MNKIRYAVVGLGHIAQVAVLPAFAHAKKNSILTALVSDDEVKLKALGRKYKIADLYKYEEYELLLDSGLIDAVYIATPNNLHRNFVEPALKRNIHVLCEKPLTSDLYDSMALFNQVQDGSSKFMTAYRLHFDPANLKAVEWANSGKLGDVRIFNSVFTMQVEDKENIRLKAAYGGGTLNDIGIYCINAARYIFQAEPYEVFASEVKGTEERFEEVDEMTAVTMRFPQERLASFICSFGASDCATYDVVGTKGSLRLESAYDYAMPMKLITKINDKTKTQEFSQHDQFSAELLYFSDCILKDVKPEPSVKEGLIDVEIIYALKQSIKSGKPVLIQSHQKKIRPDMNQKIVRPKAPKVKPVHASAPSKD